MKHLSLVDVPQSVISSLEDAITMAVLERIEDDPACFESILRININSSIWEVRTLSTDDGLDNLSQHDIPLLELMWDSCDRELFPTGQAQWIPDQEAIRHLAESYRQLIAFKICLN